MDQSHSAHCDAVLVTSLEAAEQTGQKEYIMYASF